MIVQREALPHRRKNTTWKVHIDNQSVFLTYGLYADGRLGEIFIDIAKQGSAIRSWIKETSMLFSVSLQHGVPLQSLISLFKNSEGDPRGMVVGHPSIMTCTGVMDFVVRCIELDFKEPLNGRSTEKRTHQDPSQRPA